MTAKPSIDPARLLEEQLAQASPDLLRKLLQVFVNTLLSAGADGVCGADYGQVSPDRTNRHNGYRHRDFEPAPVPSMSRCRSCGRARTSRGGSDLRGSVSYSCSGCAPLGGLRRRGAVGETATGERTVRDRPVALAVGPSVRQSHGAHEAIPCLSAALDGKYAPCCAPPSWFSTKGKPRSLDTNLSPGRWNSWSWTPTRNLLRKGGPCG